jgi:hypothetical protein
MDLYYYKYLKYKKKYLDLINQQGGKTYILEKPKQFKYIYDEYVKNPMFFEPILAERVVTIKGIIYDSVPLFKWIISGKDNNRQIISDKDLEIIYYNVKSNYDNNISNTKEKIIFSDFDIFDKIIKLKTNKLINNNNCYCYIDYSYNYLI